MNLKEIKGFTQPRQLIMNKKPELELCSFLSDSAMRLWWGTNVELTASVCRRQPCQEHGQGKCAPSSLTASSDKLPSAVFWLLLNKGPCTSGPVSPWQPTGSSVASAIPQPETGGIIRKQNSAPCLDIEGKLHWKWWGRGKKPFWMPTQFEENLSGSRWSPALTLEKATTSKDSNYEIIEHRRGINPVSRNVTTVQTDPGAKGIT